MFLRFEVSGGCEGGCEGGCGDGCGGGQGGGDGCDGCGNAACDPFAMIIKRVLSASKCRINFVP